MRWRVANGRLQHPFAIASSCDHAGRDGFRLWLVDRLAGWPSHPLISLCQELSRS
jgi:hypothetical protein